jgi:hypothetical protein
VVARSAVERYLVGAFAFLAAAIWLGVGLKNGFVCLLVFVLAFQGVRLYQRRSAARSRPAPARRERPSRHRPSSSEERNAPRPAASGRERSQPSGQVYDGDGEEIRWPMPSEATW